MLCATQQTTQQTAKDIRDSQISSHAPAIMSFCYKGGMCCTDSKQTLAETATTA